MPDIGYTLRRSGLLMALISVGLTGCQEVEDRIPRWLFDARTPRERYQARLTQVGLTETAVVRDWLAAADRALTEAPVVTTPHTEEGFLPPAEPGAVAYRVEVRRGQEIALTIQSPGDSTTLWFLDAWELPDDTLPPRRLAVADSGARTLTVRPRRDGSYIVRAQPEILRGGRFTASVTVDPTLAFPVLDGRPSDILSRYGASRDGGRRQHQGIDIFAPRGTAALAAAAGTIVRVDTTRLGGNVVWLRDRYGNALYYAHLDRPAVVRGRRVAPGDTVGYVGNTGNARTTPPHLHFGVYRRGEGALDPYWFVIGSGGSVPSLAADTSILGGWGRTRTPGIALQAAPAPRAAAVTELARHTALRIVAATGRWYRVRLPDGESGYLPSQAVESTALPLAAAEPAAAQPVLLRPDPNSSPEEVRAEVTPGDSLAVLAEFGDYRLVRLADGAAGWLAK